MNLKWAVLKRKYVNIKPEGGDFTCKYVNIKPADGVFTCKFIIGKPDDDARRLFSVLLGDWGLLWLQTFLATKAPRH